MGETLETTPKRKRPGWPAAEPPPRRRRGRWAHTYAAIDLGTNNCRLLVARPTKEGFRVIDAYSRIVRLGEGIGRDKQLSEPAMERTLDALKVCAHKMQMRRVTRYRAIATEACRRAVNGDVFLDRARKETGIDIQAIDAHKEADLALKGCTSLFARAENRPMEGLLFDIGGGSIQLMRLRIEDDEAPLQLLGATSVACGVVRLSERFGGVEVDHESYAAMLDHVAEHVMPFVGAHPCNTHGPEELQIVGTSGTVTTLGALLLGLPRYSRAHVDGMDLTFDEIRDVTARLMEMSHDDRVAHPCIGLGRADLVLAGCAALEAICRAWPAGRLRVADRGLREGMLLELMARADHEARIVPRPFWRDKPLMAKQAGGSRRSDSSVRWLARQQADPFVREARRRGYRSRAAFKLEQIDAKFGLLRPGMKVVDLGCAPGGWTQVAVERVAPRPSVGAVVGVDIVPVDPIPDAVILLGDVTSADTAKSLSEALGGPADVVLSDMAAAATGHSATDHLRTLVLAEAALELARKILVAGGAFVVKVLQGAGEPELFADMRQRFGRVQRFKPKASRSESTEMYIVTRGFEAAVDRT